MPDTTPAVQRHILTLKSLFVPLLTHPRIAQVIKWTVYLCLLINTWFYFEDDYLAMQASLPPDAPLLDILTRFSTTLDMLAWIGLIVLFELETWSLPDEAFTPWVVNGLRLGRLLCYISIATAAWGYTVEGLDNHRYQEVEGVGSACELAGSGVAMQLDQIQWVDISADNCAELSSDTRFYRLEGEVSVIPASVLPHLQKMGWLDVLNAILWIGVVLLIEVEVWLQAQDRFASRLLIGVRLVKTLSYLVLIGNGVVWVVTDYYLYAWDAFLWIFGFWAIEFNLAFWEKLRLEELAQAEAAPAGAAV